MGHSVKIGLVLAISVLVTIGFSQDSFSFPIGDDVGGTLSTIPGPDSLTQTFDIEFTSGLGILEKNLPNFPDVVAGPTPSAFQETITNNQPGSQITSYRESAWRLFTADKGHWVNAGITLDDGSNCTLVSPALTNTCGDITITIAQSDPGIVPAGSNDVVIFEFHNNPQGFGDTFVIQNDLAFLGVAIGNSFTMMIHELANTEAQAPVGSISIPLDSTLMLVAGSEMNSIWITLALVSAIGIGIFFLRRNYFSAE